MTSDPGRAPRSGLPAAHGTRNARRTRGFPRRVGLPAWLPLALTRRGLVVAVLLVGLAVMAVYPVRSYMNERAQLQQLGVQHGRLTAQIAALQQQEQLLQDPGYVDMLAEQDLHMVGPGRELYVLVGNEPVGPAGPAALPVRPGAAQSSWYQRAWQRLVTWLTG